MEANNVTLNEVARLAVVALLPTQETVKEYASDGMTSPNESNALTLSVIESPAAMLDGVSETARLATGPGTTVTLKGSGTANANRSDHSESSDHMPADSCKRKAV